MYVLGLSCSKVLPNCPTIRSKERGQPSCSRRGNSSANEGLIRKCSDHRTDDAQNDFSIKMSGTTGVESLPNRKTRKTSGIATPGKKRRQNMPDNGILNKTDFTKASGDFRKIMLQIISDGF